MLAARLYNCVNNADCFLAYNALFVQPTIEVILYFVQGIIVDQIDAYSNKGQAWSIGPILGTRRLSHRERHLHKCLLLRFSLVHVYYSSMIVNKAQVAQGFACEHSNYALADNGARSADVHMCFFDIGTSVTHSQRRGESILTEISNMFSYFKP